MEKDGPWEVHTLTIPEVALEDAGTFEVTASNRVGKAAAKANLIVVTEPPMFPRPLEDVTTKLGKTEVFEVRNITKPSGFADMYCMALGKNREL